MERLTRRGDRDRRRSAGAVVLTAAVAMIAAGGASSEPGIQLLRDDDAGKLRVVIGGRDAIIYQYAATLDIPHYWPMNSPQGRNMLVQKTLPYPHHRSFWFADTIRLDGGRPVSTYNAFTTGREIEPQKEYDPPFRDHIRHLEFVRLEAVGSRAIIDAKLLWEMDGGRPVVEERRHVVVHALGSGEYLLDMTFALTSSFGAAEFVSDEVHYAWPYLRLEKRWSGEAGGIIASDSDARGQEATNLKPAKWIDYSNTVEGEIAGIAVYQWPDGADHRWLTREYGCFGPRRPDDKSGKPFALEKGKSIEQRVGVLVHAGDRVSGRVAERYRQYIAGRWNE